MSAAKTRTEELLQEMAGARVPPEDAQRAVARRERVVARLEQLQGSLVLRRDRLRQLKRRVALLAVAAIPALVMGAGWYAAERGREPGTLGRVGTESDGVLELSEGQAAIERNGKTLQAHLGKTAVTNGDVVVTTARTHAALRLLSGARVELAIESRVRVQTTSARPARAERIELEQGRVALSVPHLASGQLVAVRTPHATVEVHGTKFSVAMSGSDPSAVTNVAVTEGIVRVRHARGDTWLRAGATWTSAEQVLAEPSASAAGRELEAAPPPPNAADSAANQRKPRATAPARSANASLSERAPSANAAAQVQASQLADQNRLFSSAMDARRRGDDGRAVAVLDTLLLRYPGSPLAQEARVERFRALQRLGDTQAAAHAARRYLAEHPDGFASDEARALALDPPSSAGPTAH